MISNGSSSRRHFGSLLESQLFLTRIEVIPASESGTFPSTLYFVFNNCDIALSYAYSMASSINP